MSSLNRRITKIEKALAARAASPDAAPFDTDRFFVGVAALGARGSVAGIPGVSGTPDQWRPFFNVWPVFSAASAAWAARGDTPPADFCADAPAELRQAAWHLTGSAHRRYGREEPAQLREFSMLILHALDIPIGRDRDDQRLSERPAMPAEVLQVFINDGESLPWRECADCGCFLPLRIGQQGGPEPFEYFSACPACGYGRVGWGVFRRREQDDAGGAATRGDRSAPAGTEVEAGQQADARPTRRTVDVGRIVEDDDDPTFGLVAGRPRRPRF